MPDELTACPNCGQTLKDGYLNQIVHIKHRVMLVHVTIGIRILYSYKCGFFKAVVLL